MGSLYRDMAEAGRKPRPEHQTCGVAKVLDVLDDGDRRDLVTALTDTTITAADIARILRDRGYDVSPHTVQRHRRHDCSCPRDEET